MFPDVSACGTEALIGIASDPRRAAALHALIGPFFHLVRNRLNSLQMCVYLGRRAEGGDTEGGWHELDRLYREAERVVEQFQTLCRPMPLSPLPIGFELILNDVASRWSPPFAARGVPIQVDTTLAGEGVRIDPSRWSSALNAVATWRSKQVRPGTRVILRAGNRGCRSFLEWDERRDGRHCGEGHAGEDQTGLLPLAMLARVATAHGGAISQDAREGWKVSAEWPSAEIT